MSSNVFGHWIWAHAFPDNAVGFIYEITNLLTGKKYIGRKQLTSNRKKTVKQKTDPTKKKNIRVISESNWKSYTGSCVKLNEDIKAFGKENFRFEILQIHTSKSSLNYGEVETLVKRGALTEYLPCGEPAFYNGLIPPCRTRPKQ